MQAMHYSRAPTASPDKKIWDYVNELSEFNNYINAPLAVYHEELYNLPFNMNTLLLFIFLLWKCFNPR